MGLIKAATSAIGSTLHDQWKEAIRCEDLDNDTLMVRKTTETGVITSGSTIVVAPGQCAVIYDNGKVIDATAEDGLYTFDTSSSPSFFGGQFKETFKEMWQRFTYNGATSKQQSVYFFNLKEIIGNKFGTATPIPFQDWSHAIQNSMLNSIMPMSVKVRCYGTYTFKIYNPAIFMTEIAGTADRYTKNNLLEQIRIEVMATFQNVLNELGNSVHKVPVLELPSQTDEIKQMMDEKVFDEPIRRRGLQIVSFAVESVSLDEESEEKINKYEQKSSDYMRQARIDEAYANALENASSNSAGAMNGFMGVGIVNMSRGAAYTGAPNTQNTSDGKIQYDPYAVQTPVNEPVKEKTQTVEQNIQTQPLEEPKENNEQVQEIKNRPETVNEEKLTTQTPTPVEERPKEQLYKMCKKCGNMSTEDAKFCSNCGNQF